MKKVNINIEATRSIIAELKETLNPGTCRCFIDAFLTHKENLEVRNFHSETKPLVSFSFCPMCVRF